MGTGGMGSHGMKTPQDIWERWGWASWNQDPTGHNGNRTPEDQDPKGHMGTVGVGPYGIETPTDSMGLGPYGLQTPYRGHRAQGNGGGRLPMG